MTSARALLFAGLTAATTLPYNPTSIFAWSNSTSVDIVESDRIVTLDLSDLSKNTTSALPFNGSARSIFQSNTDIIAITGDCSKVGSQLWRKGTGWTAEAFESSTQWLAQGFVQDSIYLFGGMCPIGNGSWTVNASYSGSMNKLSQSTNGYSSNAVGSAGPVAEAGFTITGMSTSNRISQHVLIGGHTRSAFINMSQAAIFTLPQETWTFIPLQQPQNVTVEPRSGHTAVLTQDGSKIVVLGGWVGDVSTPAQPQLAILDIGSAYGQWQWTVPAVSSASVFGHGAAMLPGNVMMVYGGYSSDLTPQTQLHLFNVSSSSWISEYRITKATESSDDSTKIGLAVGLTIGLLIFLGLVVFYFWYKRRSRRRQSALECSLLSRSSNGSYTHISQPFLEKNSIDGRGGDFAALNPYWAGPDGSTEEQSNTTGMFVDNPSPTRGLRKIAPTRNYQYHVAARFDERGRRSDIHPIAEIDEESTRLSKDEHLSEAERQLKEVEAILNSTTARRNPASPLGNQPVPPEHGQPAHKASPNWTVEPVGGRVSPSKTDDRTSSSLSERSQRSMFSDNSITRTMSTRTGTLLAAAAAAHVRAKAVEAETSGESRSNTMSTTGRTSPVSRRTVARSSTNGSSRTGSRMAGYAESFRTARSNATYDGEGLLTRPNDRDDPYRRALAANDLSGGRRRQGILGSLRKAIGAISSPIQRPGAEYDQLQSTNSSPTKERPNPVDSPRRTVSDGGALLRQKRGQQDWQDAYLPYRDDPDPGDWGERVRTSTEKQQAEEEWDVEDAAAKRDVQIMFTIPKSRLRVVNADMDRASLRSVSDGALSRAGSLRVLRREESKVMLMDSMPEVEGDDKDKSI